MTNLERAAAKWADENLVKAELRVVPNCSSDELRRVLIAAFKAGAFWEIDQYIK